MTPEEIYETQEYRDLLARYNGLCETATTLQNTVDQFTAREMVSKADKERDKLLKLQQDVIMQGQVNTLNQTAQDLGTEIQRLRDLVRELGGNPDADE